ncbi:DsbA family protein [Sphingomonas sp. XXL09]|uniref:DsbA family protein n=1 Tax=Sphingomonas sp. XXL09 TaxID=3457787 RepID=UPI00406BD24E
MKTSSLIAVAALGAVVGAGAVWSVDRFAAPVPGRAGIERVVRDYVVTHPEIIVQAMQTLQNRESGKAVAANRDAIATPFAGAWAGNPKGDVTLVEFYDYNCGYCRASLPMIADLIKRDPGLRVVYRELPILGPTSRPAARASLAAAQQGKFGAFHEALYAAGPVSEASIAATAARTGVALPGSNAPVLDQEIAKNMDVAAKLGVTGTPTWIVGDQMLSGALPVADLERAIAAARGH